MEQMKQKSAQRMNLNTVLGVENTLLYLQKTKELEKDKKEKITF